MVSDAPATSPYVGPQPFERGQHAVFFGRVGELQQLRTMVLGNPVVLLYAASGAGKTSLLNAGLIPMLEKQDDFQVLPTARVTAAERPMSTNPYVSGVLASWMLDEDTPPPGADSTIAEFLAGRPHPDAPDGWSAPRLAVIDQLEEVFTLLPQHWEQRNEFFAQLGAAIAADPLLRVILVIREDYTYEIEPQRVRLPGRLKARFRLELLREPAALEAIVRPLKGTGHEFAPAWPSSSSATSGRRRSRAAQPRSRRSPSSSSRCISR